jgi:hypothetical protein
MRGCSETGLKTTGTKMIFCSNQALYLTEHDKQQRMLKTYLLTLQLYGKYFTCLFHTPFHFQSMIIISLDLSMSNYKVRNIKAKQQAF